VAQVASYPDKSGKFIASGDFYVEAFMGYEKEMFLKQNPSIEMRYDCGLKCDGCQHNSGHSFVFSTSPK
jgi:hypothetical protein